MRQSRPKVHHTLVSGLRQVSAPAPSAGPTQNRPSADVDGLVERERRNAFGRGADVAEQLVGEARSQVWGSDAFPTQFTTPAAQHQLCLTHQVRDLAYPVEVDGPNGSPWARELRHVFSRELRLHRERGRVTPAISTNRRVQVEHAATGRPSASRSASDCPYSLLTASLPAQSPRVSA